jgi:hypothetical protein
VRFRVYVLAVGLSSLAMLRTGHAADGPVDDGLLEFLGSVDSDDKNWHDYLAGADIDQAAGHAGNAPANPAPSAAPSPPPAAAKPAPSAPPVAPP